MMQEVKPWKIHGNNKDRHDIDEASNFQTELGEIARTASL